MGKKGGTEKTETTVKMHPEIEAAALKNIGLANEVAAMGAMPYRGPQVAGFSPQQLAAMQGTDQAAQAFGMPNAGSRPGMNADALYSALTGLPPPQQFAGGFSGYSAAPIMDQQMQNLPPAQRAMLESFVMNPVTGAQPSNPAVPRMSGVTVDPALARTPQERMAIIAANEQRALQKRVADAKAAASKASPWKFKYRDYKQDPGR